MLLYLQIYHAHHLGPGNGVSTFWSWLGTCWSILLHWLRTYRYCLATGESDFGLGLCKPWLGTYCSWLRTNLGIDLGLICLVKIYLSCLGTDEPLTLDLAWKVVGLDLEVVGFDLGFFGLSTWSWLVYDFELVSDLGLVFDLDISRLRRLWDLILTFTLNLTGDFLTWKMATLSYLLRAGSVINQNYPVNLLCFITVQKNYTVKYTSDKLEKQKCIIFSATEDSSYGKANRQVLESSIFTFMNPLWTI